MKKLGDSSHYFLERVLWTRSFSLVFFALIVVMQLDFFFQLKAGELNSEAFASSFLASPTSGSNATLHLIILGILPVYLFLAVGKTHSEDVKSGQILAVWSRLGKRNYYLGTYLSAALLTFLMIFVALAINLLVVKIAASVLPAINDATSVFPLHTRNFWDRFGNQKYLVIQEPNTQFAVWQVKHGFLAFLLYGGTFSFFSALISVLTISLSRIFRKAYQTLVVIMMLYVLATSQSSIGILGERGFQPCLPVMFNDWLWNIIILLGSLIAINAVLIWWLNREEEELEI